MNMIISPSDFVYNGALITRNDAGRCYILVEPSGRQSKAARKGLLTNKRISLAHYRECLKNCKEKMGGAV